MILRIALDLPKRQLFDYLADPNADDLPAIGSRIRVTCAGTVRCGVVAGYSSKSAVPAARLRTIEASLGGMLALPGELLAALQLVARDNFLPHGRFVMRALPQSLRVARQVAYRALPAAGAVREFANVQAEEMLKQYVPKQATSGQPLLLAGLVDIGQAAILIALAANRIAAGGQVLVLAPTVADASSWRAHFAEALAPAKVDELHSGLTGSEYLASWHAAAAGAVHVVVGVRNAVFAPMHKLAMIAVIDEHDENHRVSSGLRYSIRDAAAVRASIAKDCQLVLTSATPSLEVRKAVIDKTVRIHALPRAADAAGPDLTIADITGRRLFGGISSELENLVRDQMSRGEMTAVFAHRGYRSGALCCAECRTLRTCSACSGLVVASKGQASCNRCGTLQALATSCTSCGHVGTDTIRPISARIAKALSTRLEEARIFSMSSRENVAQVAQAARSGSIDVLIGGPELAVLPRLFSAIVLADVDNVLLSSRLNGTAELLANVTRLAARPSGCRILVQTRFPDHHLFAALERGSHDAYALAELDQRRAAGMPPFRRLALLVVSAETQAGAIRFIGKARTLAKQYCTKEISFLDPAPAKKSKSSGEHMQMLISAPDRPSLRSLLEPWLNDLERAAGGARKVRWSISLDPQLW